MRLFSILAVAASLLINLAQANPLPAETDPFNVTGIAPEHQQDPLNITDVELYKKIYKRGTGCDPIGCFDSNYFSAIFRGSYPDPKVILYGAGQKPVEKKMICTKNWQETYSFLPWTFVFKWQPYLFGCYEKPGHFQVRYATLREDTWDGLDHDTRCGQNGGTYNGKEAVRCIWPIRPDKNGR